ncbi:MAG: chlorite dismutase family protein [Chloroflexota bacterium]
MSTQAEQTSRNGAQARGAQHGPHGVRRGDTPRVCVAFTFYRASREVFALPADERRQLAAEFESVVDEASESLGILRSYSLVGLRPDVDLLLWQAADQPEGLQQVAARLRTARLYGYLETPHHYLAMTRRSIYVDDHRHEGQDGRRTTVQPAGAPYLFVYPFVKTRAWYALPMAERQRMMDEHIAVGHDFPSVKINTTYSFGLDDQEFVVAFEAENPSEFLDLVMKLRSAATSAYTLRDTPAFTAVAQPLGHALALSLGLAVAAPAPEALQLAAAT